LAVDGSFLVFRFLSQTVLEFDNFLRDHPLPVPGLTPAEGSELLGARLVGRWKSGASSCPSYIISDTCGQELPLT
jgi:hypothetical protein